MVTQQLYYDYYLSANLKQNDAYEVLLSCGEAIFPRMTCSCNWFKRSNYFEMPEYPKKDKAPPRNRGVER